MIAGNRRKQASELADKDTLLAIVRVLDDDAAIIFMAYSNMQRETILPSEKAMAYKLKVEALKRQRARNDLTSVQIRGADKGPKGNGKMV